jgi:hypothetical protein
MRRRWAIATANHVTHQVGTYRQGVRRDGEGAPTWSHVSWPRPPRRGVTRRKGFLIRLVDGIAHRHWLCGFAHRTTERLVLIDRDGGARTGCAVGFHEAYDGTPQRIATGFVRDAPRGGLDSRLPRRCRPTGSRRPRAAAAARAGVAGPERRHVSQTGADAASHRRRIRPAPVRPWTASWSGHRVHLGGGRRRPSVGGVGASMP